MTIKLIKSGIFLIIWLFASESTLAYDTEKEKYWEEEIQNNIQIGKVESLEADNHKFLGIFTPESGNLSQGTIILLHDYGMHMDWPELINLLRTRLPDFGWSTLSLQMPIPEDSTPLTEYEPLFQEASKRIEAGEVFLQAKGIRNIVLVGHGLGANMGAYHLSTIEKTGISAYIGISMELLETKPDLSILQMLEKIRVPMLDIFGLSDRPEVTLSAPNRIRSAKRGAASAFKNQDVEKLNKSIRANSPGSDAAGFVSFRQITISGADHVFSQQEDELIKRIRGWLKRHAPKRKVNK